jgi:hypothetical protein
MGHRFLVAIGVALQLLVASSAHAFALKQTTGGANVTWRQNEVRLNYDRSVLDHPGLLAALDRALAVWRTATATPLVRRGNAVHRVPANDGENVVFVSDGAYEPAHGALAVTMVSYDERTGAILDADIVLNGAYSFASLGTGKSTRKRSGPTYDTARVLGHELGHLLGLEDELEDRSALMFLGTSTESRLAAQLGDDDLEGMTVLYAPVPPADGRGCAMTPPSAAEPRSAERATRDLVPVPAALLVLLVLRRRQVHRPRPASAAPDDE